ncbi:MAG: PAS domain S-box protein, partial [Chloroflexota bacterium]
EEVEFRIKSGEVRTMLLSCEEINVGGRQCLISVSTDITERKKGEQLQQDENYVLTLLGQGAELNEILDALLRLGEEHDPSIKGSVLLFDSSKDWLMPAAGPSLPDAYNEMMKEGIPIGPVMGSCGTAAYRKERVIVPDIKNSPLFKPSAEAAKLITSTGLLSCLSQPIISSSGELLGTIANYGDKVGEPNADNIRVLEWSARIAGIAIERRRAEEALRESEDKFSRAFYSSPEGITITRLKDNQFIDVNDTFVRVAGYTREEAINNSSVELSLWAQEEERTRILGIMKEQGRVSNEEVQFRTKSGQIRTVLFSMETINIGNEPCAISMAADITERKRMEEALRESEQKFATAFNTVPDALSIFSLKDGKFIEVNNNYVNFSGYPRDELIGHDANELNMWATAEEPGRLITIINTQGRIIGEEFGFRKKSGEVRRWLFSGESMNIKGEPCMILVTTDITERKQAEEKLKQALQKLEASSARLIAANKEMEAFSYSVSHDLRAPLRSIDGFSLALLEDHADKLDDTGQDYLRRLRGASQKMGELIDGLLKLSRLTRGEMQPRKVDLTALAGEIAERLKENDPERQAEFVINRGLTAYGDPDLLRVLLENLLGNAWKFTGMTPQARIEFGAQRNGKIKAYFVTDNGAGFDMTYAGKLFRAFQRLHDAAEFPGTGIGLATAQRIINRHSGTIWAEGQVGKGATFYFTLS